jgi:Glycoside hydrolase family 5 C-terminal domain/Cellulase (glycosyl hydrolase family 5)
MKNRRNFYLLAVVIIAVILPGGLSCEGEQPEYGSYDLPEVSTDLTHFKDDAGRYVYFNGVNVSGSTKLPWGVPLDLLADSDADALSVDMELWDDYKVRPTEFIGEPYGPDAEYKITYINKPFPLEDADQHYAQLRDLGFNSIRLLINWEGLMPHKPPIVDGVPQYEDVIDREYVEYLGQIVEKAAEYGIYVLLDMHQDAFSRHLAAQYNDTFDDIMYGDSQRGADGRLGANDFPFFDTPTEDMITECPTTMDELLDDPATAIAGLAGTLNSPLAYLPYLALGCPERGSIFTMLLALLLNNEGKYDNVVSGEGAPWWVVQAALPEKDMNSPYWGYPRFFANEATGETRLSTIATSLENIMGMDPGEVSDLVESVEGFIPLPSGYSVTETVDTLPTTNWGMNLISIDQERAWASFFAGRDAFPGNIVEGTNLNVQDYLQDAYEVAWIAVAERCGHYENVIGYDIINEPMGLFLTLTVAAAYFDLQMEEEITNMLISLFDQQNVLESENVADDYMELLKAVNVLPPDTSAETKAKWGFEHANLMAILGLNMGFDANYAQPFYEKIGQAIERVDPDAIIWFEGTMGLGMASQYLGGGGAGGDGGAMQMNPSKPALKQPVYAPHWYPDIYPLFGFAMPPRDFVPTDVKYRSYTSDYEGLVHHSEHHLGNIPVVVGEFGTWFNFNQPRQQNTPDNDYVIATEVLDNHYEAHEELFQHRMVWCWSAENDWRNGEGWNHEDFSVVDPNLEPRSENAYNRPHPRAMAGKPISLRFFSPNHYFDPDKGVVDQVGYFELKFASKETEAPTEIFVPEIQYPEGFYVYLSDGWATYDHISRILYYSAAEDRPDHVHTVILRKPQEGQVDEGFNYFIKDDLVLTGPGGGLQNVEVLP